MKYKFVQHLERGDVIHLDGMQLTVADIAVGIEKVALRFVGNIHDIRIREISIDVEVLVLGSVQLSDADEVIRDAKDDT
jgi:hypothetical protein